MAVSGCDQGCARAAFPDPLLCADLCPMPVIENFLHSNNYQNLYQNLLDNWTKHNNFFYTTTFDGEFQEISDNGLFVYFVESIAFVNHVVELLPEQQKKQIAKLALSFKFKDLTTAVKY